MRIVACVVAWTVVSVGVARAQEAQPQYAPQAQPYAQPGQPQYGQPGQPQYAQPYPGAVVVQPANPLQDPQRLAEWQRLRGTSHKLSVGGKVALGIGIPFFLIGMSVGIVAVYNNGVYLCSGISCDRTAAAAVGFTMGVLGAAGIGGGIAMLVLSNGYYEKAERVRMGGALSLIPGVAPLARADGRGFDGVTLAWGGRF